MKTIELRDDDFQRLADITYSDLSSLKNWEQPLKFRENTYVIEQKASGPCGFLAVLNSHIVLKKNDPENSSLSQDDLLISVLLDLFTRVSTYRNTSNPEYKPIYAFCDCLIPENNYIHFQYTESSDEAYNFLNRTNYVNAYNACLMITLSIIFSSLGMKEFQNPPEESYIFTDKMTSMSFVWLMLNGSCTSDAIKKVEESNFVGIAQQEIGLKVLDNPDKRVVGTWLNQKARIFVCHKFMHFFATKINGDKLIVYDSLNEKSPYEINRDKLEC